MSTSNTLLLAPQPGQAKTSKPKLRFNNPAHSNRAARCFPSTCAAAAGASGAWIHLAGRTCPLTPLENHLRARAGSGGYAGGFVEHYVLPVLYPDFLPRTTSVGLGIFLLVFNTLLYGRLLRRVSPAP